MDLAIIAGGKGTRLGLIDIPKPMIKIGDIPLLELQINIAKKYGIKKIYILSGYLSEIIKEYFGDGKIFGVEITHIVEVNELGTAGAVKQLEGILLQPFMVFYGDTYFDINLIEFIYYSQNSKYSNHIAAIFVHPNDHPYDSDLVEIDNNSFVSKFHSKPHEANKYYPNLVNAALYILDPKIFKYIPDNQKSDFGKKIFPEVIKNGGKIIAYKTSEYIKDIGTTDRIEKVRADYNSGKCFSRNKSNVQKCIFLDRDGVINKEINNLHNIKDFELIDGVAKAIRKINQSNYLSIVVTNQPVIAKGFCSNKQLNEIHNKMDTLLGKERAYVDDLYYCPHHPETGFIGEIKEYKIMCNCRKPKPGMLLQAKERYNIDFGKSFIVGDRYIDIITGKNVGLKTILVKTGHSGSDINNYSKPDYEFNSLLESVEYILENNNNDNI